MNRPRLTALSHAILLAGVLATGTAAAERLVAEFEPFLGAETSRIVAGLRDGTTITLPAGAPDDKTATVAVKAPFGEMGEVNVERSLRVARAVLERLGIRQPTGAQLHAALLGGEVRSTTGETARLEGVLTMRQQNLGWGEIAQRSGVSLDELLKGDPLYGR